LTAPETVDAFGRFLERLADYYAIAPQVFWAVVALIWTAIVAWGYRGRASK